MNGDNRESMKELILKFLKLIGWIYRYTNYGQHGFVDMKV